VDVLAAAEGIGGMIDTMYGPLTTVSSGEVGYSIVLLRVDRLPCESRNKPVPE
jgi:hypothetical protein